MSSISVYMTCTNAIKDEYCIVESIKSALVFADEVIVVDGLSSDGTLEAIDSLNDNRVWVKVSPWLYNLGMNMHAINRSIGIGSCDSDWCMLLDADEVIHEDDAVKITEAISTNNRDIIAFDCNTLHFYKDYYHLLNGCSDWKDLYTHKTYIVRNYQGIYHGNIGLEPDAHVLMNGNPIPENKIKHIDVNIFHYGHAREKLAYIRKQNNIRGAFSNWKAEEIKAEDFEWLPEWKLTKFKGSHPNVMGDI